MGKGIRKDLVERLTNAHEKGTCLVPTCRSDAHRLHEACKRGDVMRPAKQVYALPELWATLNPLQRELHRLRALATLHPTWVFADVSAAVLYGLDVSYGLLGKIHLARDVQSHTRDTQDVHHHAIHGDELARVGNTRVTSLERTVFDCTRTYAFPYALGIADSALRVYGKSQVELVDSFVRMHKRHRNVWRAIDTVLLADPRAENGGESYARAIMIREGYIRPDLQVEIPDVMDSHNVYRVDFYWDLDAFRVAGELDGREKYTNPSMTGGRDVVDVLADERLRESRLTAELKVMRFSFDDVRDTKQFRQLLSKYGIPRGFTVPKVAMA